MNLLNKKYFKEDLNTDIDGKKWQFILSFVINKTNIMEFRVDIANTNDEIQNKIVAAEKYIKHLGFSKNIIEIFATNFYYHKLYSWNYIIARLSLDSKLKNKVCSYKTLVDFVLKNDSDIFDPAFYFDDTALLWTVTSMGYANILLSEKQRNLLIRQGFVLEGTP